MSTIITLDLHTLGARLKESEKRKGEGEREIKEGKESGVKH